MQDSDAKLVHRCVSGDSRAWDSFIRSYSGRLMNMAFRYTGSYSVAEELTQEVFLKVYQNLPAFRPQAGSLQNWVMRVGRNLIIDYYRAHKREKNVAGSEELEVLDFGADPHTPNPFENLYLREKAQFLYRGLECLSPELKEAVVLRDIEGLAYQEIADLLQIPEGTVKSRINRGRIELANVLRRMKSEQAS
ncbi:MAG: sigma-70 family RNA polymerase sigma factor [Acidobacteriota bacterium]